MEELAKLEEERGTPGYVPADKTAQNSGWEAAGGHDRKGGVSTPGDAVERERKGKRGRVASNEMCTFLILNISSLHSFP